MGPRRRNSDKKQKLIDAFHNKALVVGDEISLTDDYCNDKYDVNVKESYDILEICGDSVKLKSRYNSNGIVTVPKSAIKCKDNDYKIGVNPFNSKYDPIRPMAFSIESIVYKCDLFLDEKRNRNTIMSGKLVSELNWNPYVYVDGEKKYYQRGFVWTLKQNQLLIESIYQGISCGAILIRKRGWDNIESVSKTDETELAFNDIVDGKQRLNAIRGFINDEYQDLCGNYYSDLSHQAQNKLLNNHLFNYAEMSEHSSDEEVLYQFLKMNFEGVPQSVEHLDYVKSLIK